MLKLLLSVVILSTHIFATPNVTIRPRNVFKKIAQQHGGNLILYCDLGSVGGNFSWFHNGHPLEESKYDLYTFADRESRLFFNNPTKELSGVYTCRVTLVNGTVAEANATVDIIPPFDIIAESLENFTANETESVSLSCRVSPRVNISRSWSFNGVQKLGPEFDEHTGTYFIKSVSRSNEGNYTCFAIQEDDFGNRTETRTVILEVNYAPSFEETKEIDVSQQTGVVNMSCPQTSAKPSATVFWASSQTCTDQLWNSSYWPTDISTFSGSPKFCCARNSLGIAAVEIKLRKTSGGTFTFPSLLATPGIDRTSSSVSFDASIFPLVISLYLAAVH